MTRVLYFSAAGHSRAIAEYFASLLGLEAEDILRFSPGEVIEADMMVLVFPVYCQTLPLPLRSLIGRIEASRFVLVASYGQMHHGNALYEAAALCKGEIVGAAYIPTGHSYLREEADFDRSAIAALSERMKEPGKLTLPPERSQSWAAVFPALRCRLGVRITKNSRCTGCGVCNTQCPIGTMNCGKPGGDCIRCLRCVHFCPEGALDFKLSLPMRLYLGKKKINDTILYL